MRKLLRGVHHYVIFFLLVAFLVTCCIMLFTRTLIASLGVELTSENLNTAAKLTFGNVLLLSLLFTLVDTLRRKLTVERTARHIAEATKRIVAGDFTVRVPKPTRVSNDESFFEIIDCFNRMAEELGSVEALRTDFIASVSHEMKTPLAVIQNYCTLLLEEHLPDDSRLAYARAARDSARRLADMVVNILKLNKLENQQIFPQQDSFDLGEQLCECLLQFESVWEQADIAIETDIADDVTIRSDRELLSLVWNNLLSNAFKFTPDGGTVRLSLSATPTHAAVTVQDTGVGMSAETGRHIFEKFYQGDASRATKGNGLGLPLVRRVVDIMGGEITVQSAPGQGSTFTVTIRRS